MGTWAGQTGKAYSGGQLHMWAHEQDRQAKHSEGTVKHVGTWARQIGKAYSGETVKHVGTWAGQTGKAYNGYSYTCGHMGNTDRQTIQWGQLHMVAHGQNRQAKHSRQPMQAVGTVRGTDVTDPEHR